MFLYRFAVLAITFVWIYSIGLWLTPEETRWNMGLFNYYRLTFLELPLFAALLGTILVFRQASCTSSRLFKAAHWLCWSYVFFPVVTSGLLILMTLLGITGY